MVTRVLGFSFLAFVATWNVNWKCILYLASDEKVEANQMNDKIIIADDF